MKRVILFTVMVLMTVASFGRKHVENATVVADTIFYAENMSNVASADQASYYRLLMTTGTGINKKDVFQDFYMNGKEKWHGNYVNGKREGYFTLQLREGGVAVVQFKNGKSVHNYFTVTYKDGTMEKRPLSDIRAFM